MHPDADPDLTDADRALRRLALAGELAAGAVHETRNVMTAILGFAQVSRRHPDDVEALGRYLRLIEREAQRSLEILDRFLGLASPASTAIEPVDVMAVIERIANLLSQQLHGGTITLEVAAVAVPLIASCRAGELEQVLVNIGLNAIQAMPAGGRIRIEARRRAGEIAIVVADTGPGVPAELRERVFDPFFTSRRRGTGLGLALCRQMLGEVGGTIHLEKSDGGARFEVRLPGGTVP